jgi:thioredoxin-like negative regulator of GroEL
MLAKTIENANIDIPVEVIDIDTNTEVAQEFGIRSVPTMILLDGNIEVKRVLGPMTPEALTRWIDG